MSIHPFLATLRACYELDGISKEELAIFLLPVLKDDDISPSIEKIKAFREQLSRYSGIERKKFIQNIHFEEFANVYAEELASGQYHTRESITSTEHEFLNKKVRNSLDVADAAIRYFRATKIVTLSADYRKLVISPMYRNEARRILNEMELPIVDYDNVEEFYEYMGNPDIPQLPWENKEELTAKAIALGVSSSTAKNLSVVELKNIIESKVIQSKEQKIREYMLTAQGQEEVQDIIHVFNRIKQNDVIDRPLFFEWNVWRAFVSMDDCENPKPNFTIDDDLKPLSTAPGNMADMEIEYNDSFVVLTEVTLSSGARQYDTEGEPVTRHIGRYQKQEMQSTVARTVYGLFIAPKINPATRDYFYVHLKHFSNPEFGGYLNIIILNTAQFIDVFSFCFSWVIRKDVLHRRFVIRRSWENEVVAKRPHSIIDTVRDILTVHSIGQCLTYSVVA